MSVEPFQLANTVIDKMLKRGNTVMCIKTEVDTSRLISDGDRYSGNLLLRIEQLAIFRNLQNEELGPICVSSEGHKRLMTEARVDGKPVYERIGTSINHFVSEDTVLSADFLRGIPFVQDIRSSIIPVSDEQSSNLLIPLEFDSYTTAKEIVDLVEKGIFRN